MAAHNANYKIEKEPSKQTKNGERKGGRKENTQGPVVYPYVIESVVQGPMRGHSQKGNTDSWVLVQTHQSEPAF